MLKIALLQANTSIVSLGTIAIATLIVATLIYFFIIKRPKSPSSKEKENNSNKEQVRIRNLYRLVATLNETLNYKRILEAAVDVGVSAFAPPDRAHSQLIGAVLLFENDYLVVETARGFSLADLRTRVPGAQGLLAHTITEGDLFVGDPSQDEELSKFAAFHKCKSVYSSPLRSGVDVYGVLLFAHPDQDFFTDENREILDIVAGQAMTAIKNARLLDALEFEKERLIETQEEARKKLARDLHDGPTQSVAAIAMRINFTRRLLERNPQEALNELEKIEELARVTTKEIRTMLFTLRPLVLESKGLLAAFETMAEKIQETYGQKVIIDVSEEVIDEFDMGKQGVIFQLAEEAVNNARKHAKSKHIWIRLKLARSELAVLEIQDDGVGFNVEAVRSSYDDRGSLGMINLSERTELLSGVLQINSKPGIGTHIRIWIPTTEDAATRLRHAT